MCHFQCRRQTRQPHTRRWVIVLGSESSLLPLPVGLSLRPLRGPIVYCVTLEMCKILRSFFIFLIKCWMHVWSVCLWGYFMENLPLRETKCSLWETPLCCSSTRRRSSVLGRSGITKMPMRNTNFDQNDFFPHSLATWKQSQVLCAFWFRVEASIPSPWLASTIQPQTL